MAPSRRATWRRAPSRDRAVFLALLALAASAGLLSAGTPGGSTPFTGRSNPWATDEATDEPTDRPRLARGSTASVDAIASGVNALGAADEEAVRSNDDGGGGGGARVAVDDTASVRGCAAGKWGDGGHVAGGEEHQGADVSPTMGLEDASPRVVASGALSGGCTADGAVRSRGRRAGDGPWSALLPVPGEGRTRCTDCRAFAGVSRRRTPRECRKVLTWCPEAESHAVSLLVLPRGGALLAAWFTGHEGMSDVAIAVSRLDGFASGPAAWTKPHSVSVTHGRSAQNPVLFQTNPAGSTVHLLHTSHAQDAGQGSSEIHHLVSDDGGLRWGPPRTVRALGMHRAGMFLRAPPLILPPATTGGAARMLLPVYHTPGGARTHYSEMLEREVVQTPFASSTEGLGNDETDPMFASSPEGWTVRTMSRPGEGLVQPTVVRVPRRDASPDAPVELLAIFRHRFEPWLYVSRSFDGGATWSDPRRSKLPSNNSGVQALALSSGAILLAFNNVAAGDAPRGGDDDHGVEGGAGGRNARSGSPPRDVLSLALSEDGGASWPYVRDLEPGGKGDPALGAVPGGLRYSYPALVEDLVTGLVHVAYTFNREAIKHVVIDEAWVRADANSGGGTVGHYSPP